MKSSKDKDKVRNYVRLRRPFIDLFCREYIYLDSEEYFADHIFERKNMRVKFYPGELKRGQWTIVRCRINKKDEFDFIKSMEELSRNVYLFTNKGDEYTEFCKVFSYILESK